MQFLKKEKINRSEKRLIKKLKLWWFYKGFLDLFTFFISVEKTFFTLIFKWIKTTIWIISVSTFSIFWNIFSYIDDFFVHRKRQWKWFWKKIFKEAIDKCEEWKTDFILLVTDIKRKRSHGLYKKFWFTLVSFWLFLLAYKKINSWKNGKK